MGWFWVDLLYKIGWVENNQHNGLIAGWRIYIQPVAYIVISYIYILIYYISIHYNGRVVFAKHKDWLEPILMFYLCYALVVAKYPLIINIDDSSCWCMSHAVSTLLIYAGYIIYWFNNITHSRSSKIVIGCHYGQGCPHDWLPSRPVYDRMGSIASTLDTARHPVNSVWNMLFSLFVIQKRVYASELILRMLLGHWPKTELCVEEYWPGRGSTFYYNFAFDPLN